MTQNDSLYLMPFKQEQTSKCPLCRVQLPNIYDIHYHNQPFTCANAIFP